MMTHEERARDVVERLKLHVRRESLADLNYKLIHMLIARAFAEVAQEERETCARIVLGDANEAKVLSMDDLRIDHARRQLAEAIARRVHSGQEVEGE